MENKIKNIYYLLCILLLVSCGNNPKAQSSETNLPIEDLKVVKEKLDTNLMRGILKLLESKEHLKYPDIRLDESFILIIFYVEPKRFSDSIVSISYFYQTFPIDDNRNNYVGMLNIDGYNIAVFDKGNFGESYYNIDSLQQIPLDGFKRYTMKYIFMEKYYVRDKKLNYYDRTLIVMDDEE